MNSRVTEPRIANMSSERELANILSWKAVEADIEFFKHKQWNSWKAQAHEFLRECFRVGLDRHFRAGLSLHHFVFSTLDHHGLKNEPRVTVELRPAKREMRVAYGRGNLHFSIAELEYTLPFGAGFATFRRFLKQLWTATATASDPFPEALTNFSAPVLPSPGQGHGNDRQ